MSRSISHMPSRPRLPRVLKLPETLIGLALCFVTAAVYCPVAHYPFINYDDIEYVTENPQVKAGLTAHGIVWAFSAVGYAGNWHPLTWLSHMTDVSLFGMNAGMHHLTSLLLHVINTLLLFLLLRSMTGALWRSALVAALFGLHPLHVESVAWIAERKDVLSALFWMITLWSWFRYIKKPGLGRYVAACAAFCLGLMSKPMLVSLPMILLLLDIWPLGRTGLGLKKLLLEKTPFFVLALASCMVTIIGQGRGGMMVSIDLIPFGLRAANAVAAWGIYCWKMVAPVNLAVLYPHPQRIVWAPMLLSALFLAAVTAISIAARRRWPFLLSGWLWFLITLLPVIGVVQVGFQAMADRYTYLPFIGLFIAIAWGADAACAVLPHGRKIAAGAAIAALACLSAVTVHQIGFWKESRILFSHALEVTSNNSLMHNNFGNMLMMEGKVKEAYFQFSEAIRISPAYADAQSNIGVALQALGKNDEAIAHYAAAIKIKPDFIKAHFNLGRALTEKERFGEAIEHFNTVLRLDPNSSQAHNNLGVALARAGKTSEGAAHIREALRLDPENDAARKNIGIIESAQKNQ